MEVKSVWAPRVQHAAPHSPTAGNAEEFAMSSMVGVSNFLCQAWQSAQGNKQTEGLHSLGFVAARI